MNYLKQKLKERNMTQIELSLKCNVLPSTINRYCKGKNKKTMEIELAYNIAKVLDLDLKEFIEEILK